MRRQNEFVISSLRGFVLGVGWDTGATLMNSSPPEAAEVEQEIALSTVSSSSSSSSSPATLSSFSDTITGRHGRRRDRSSTEAVSVPRPNIAYGCDPCIDRPSHTVRAVVHGSASSKFWQRCRSSAIQAGRDAGINLDFALYEGLYDESREDEMVRDIRNAIDVPPDRLPSAMVVTIPSKAVKEAVEEAAMKGVPVFGFNSGYEFAGGHEGMVAQGTLLGFFAMDEYRGGEEAAQHLWDMMDNARRTSDPEYDERRVLPVTRAMYANGEKGNIALDERYRGFRDRMRALAAMRANSTLVETLEEEGVLIVDEVIVKASDVDDSFLTMRNALDGCQYQAILVSSGRLVEPTLTAYDLLGCDFDSGGKIGAFDKDEYTFTNIVLGRLALAVSQQEHLQSALPVTFASLLVTTGNTLAAPVGTSGIYLTGPHIITRANIPSDTLRKCESDAFPMCPNTLTPDDTSQSECDCIDRSRIRIGGVVHGITTDSFWDFVFVPAERAALDLGVDLDFDRFEPQESEETLHLKMAYRILSLCQGGEVDGMFVSIPSSMVEEAVLKCLELDVPVVSINSGFDFSSNATALGGSSIAHHIGMLEYNAGYGAGERLVKAGGTVFVCISHAPTLSVMYERCLGFEDAIKEANESGRGQRLTYLGKVDVPRDNAVEYKKILEDAVGEEGGEWDGYAFLLCGVSQLGAFLKVKEAHPEAVAGSFDVSNEMYDAIDNGEILFGIDQQPYLQGYAPVVLLTQIANTKQALLNHAIETGPSFVTSSPSQEQQACEANIFQVCPTKPYEDMNYVGRGLIITGLVLFAIQAFLSVLLIVWTVLYRRRNIIKMSQPEFLVLIAFGCLVMSLSIPPLAVQGAYRYVQDPISGEQRTDMPNGAIARVDAACMAAPWLAGLGFVLVFSALSAKIWRAKRIFDGAVRFQRETVHAKDMLLIMVVMFIVEVALLLSWQLVSPLRWEREVTSWDENGYPTESIGACRSDKALAFVVPLLSFKGLCLLYALYLCYITRKVPSDLTEKKWISFAILSMFQTLAIGVPILVIVDEDNTAFFFVRVIVLFLISMTITALIFGPKVYKLHVDIPGKRINFMAMAPPGVVGFTRRISAFGHRPSPLSLSLGPDLENSDGHLVETEGRGTCKPQPTRSALRSGGISRSSRLVCSECHKKFPASELFRVTSNVAKTSSCADPCGCSKCSCNASEKCLSKKTVSFAEGEEEQHVRAGRISSRSVMENDSDEDEDYNCLDYNSDDDDDDISLDCFARDAAIISVTEEATAAITEKASAMGLRADEDEALSEEDSTAMEKASDMDSWMDEDEAL